LPPEPRRPLTAAIRANPRRSIPEDLAAHVPKRFAQPAVRRGGRQRGSRPTAVPPPLLAALARAPDVGHAGHSWSPSGPIRVVRSPQSCPPACPRAEPRSRQRGPGVTVVPPPLVAATRTSIRREPPMAAGGRHPGRSVSFNAHRAACPRARANCAAFGRIQVPPAWSSASGCPPRRARRRVHRPLGPDDR